MLVLFARAVFEDPKLDPCQKYLPQSNPFIFADLTSFIGCQQFDFRAAFLSLQFVIAAARLDFCQTLHFQRFFHLYLFLQYSREAHSSLPLDL